MWNRCRGRRSSCTWGGRDRLLLGERLQLVEREQQPALVPLDGNELFYFRILQAPYCVHGDALGGEGVGVLRLRVRKIERGARERHAVRKGEIGEWQRRCGAHPPALNRDAGCAVAHHANRFEPFAYAVGRLWEVVGGAVSTAARHFDFWWSARPLCCSSRKRREATASTRDAAEKFGGGAGLLLQEGRRASPKDRQH